MREAARATGDTQASRENLLLPPKAAGTSKYWMVSYQEAPEATYMQLAVW